MKITVKYTPSELKARHKIVSYGGGRIIRFTLQFDPFGESK